MSQVSPLLSIEHVKKSFPGVQALVDDRVTIMRDGRTVDARDMNKITRVELVATMLGKALGEVQSSGQTSFDAEKHHAENKTLLEAHDLRSGHKLRDASLTLQSGEIVGLAGLLGSGRSELARAIFGADKLEGGSVDIAGQPVHFHSPGDAIRSHIGFCSEDRKAEGIIPFLSVRDNLTLAALPLFSRYGIVSRPQQRQIVDQFIRPRGIDVGARAEIQGIIEELAENGVGVVMVAMAQDTIEEVQGEFRPHQNSTVADTTGEVFDEKD